MKTFKIFFEDNYIKYIDPETRKEVKRRVSDTFINSIVNQQTDKDDKTSHLLDSASYLKKILVHGQDTGVFDKEDKITDREVLIFFNFIKAAVPRNHLHNFLKELPRKELQKRFKAELSKSIQFSYLDILDTTCDPACRFKDALKKYPVVLNVRPAMDRYSTRGAAGPGEAFLAFMFSGKKPEGAGDLELGGDIVELKKNGGRIGKDLDSAGGGQLLKQWYPKLYSPTADALPLISDYFKNEPGDISMVDFLNTISGVREGVDHPDGRFFANKSLEYLRTNYPTYKDLIQLLGPIQMKSYFHKVAVFHTIAVFENETIIGFNRNVLWKKNSYKIQREFAAAGVEIMPKSGAGYAYDAAGYTINIKKSTGV